MKRKAFTLVELLVVVAVIVILLALIVPGLGRARASARRASCMAHERGLTQTLHMYISQWNSFIPYQVSGTRFNQWAVPLNPYGNIDGLRRCPEANLPNDKPGDPGAFNKPWNQSFTGPKQSGAFAFNGWLYLPLATFTPGTPGNPGTQPRTIIGSDDEEDDDPDDGNDNGEEGADDNVIAVIPGTPATPPTPPRVGVIPDADLYYKLRSMKRTALVPVFADAVWSDTFPHETDAPPTNLQTGVASAAVASTGPLALTCIARHDRSVNVSYFDGHTENVPLDKLWTQEWHLDWKTPSPLPKIPDK